MPPLPQLHRR
uniref:Uncharacterized protein n=1 Tax=Arundo donax TaxID=35708 RepID=A0A0A9C2N9_ARUDO